MGETEAFHTVSLGMTPPKWSAELLLVLDTNVVSALDSIAVNGFRGDIPSHQRAACLLEQASRSGVQVIDHAFDHMEGSSYHLGGIDSYNAVRRYAAVKGLLRLAALHDVSQIVSGTLAIPPEKLSIENEVARGLDRATGSLPWTFLPAYAMTLAVHASRRLDASLRVDYIVNRFEHAPFIPDAVALVGLAATWPGGSPLTEAVRKVLKFPASL